MSYSRFTKEELEALCRIKDASILDLHKALDVALKSLLYGYAEDGEYVGALAE